MINLKDFGAIGDNIHDDTVAINEWINEMRNTGAKGYAPTGKYKLTQRMLFGMPSGMGNAFNIEGDGPYKTIFDLSNAPTNQGPQVHFYTIMPTPQSNPASCYPIIRDIGFTSNTTMTLAAIGLEDMSDCVGNVNFQNVYFGNSNTSGSQSAISLQLNYVFDSTFENCVCVGNEEYGTALDIRQAVFSNFQGGSYSNANIGIRFRDCASLNNTFISPDLENVNWGIVHDAPGAELQIFINSYMDIWIPRLQAPGNGYAVSYRNGAPGGVCLDNIFVTWRSPAPVIDPQHSQYVYLREKS